MIFLKKTSYDQIYDEHVFLFSALSVSKISEKFDLRLLDAIPQSTQWIYEVCGFKKIIIEKSQKD